jgi:uncharacterized protein YcbK (DUF882 family)
MMNVDWAKIKLAKNELSTLLNQLSQEQQQQIFKANFWQIDKLQELELLQYQIKVVKAYKEVLNKRPGI